MLPMKRLALLVLLAPTSSAQDQLPVAPRVKPTHPLAYAPSTSGLKPQSIIFMLAIILT